MEDEGQWDNGTVEDVGHGDSSAQVCVVWCDLE